MALHIGATPEDNLSVTVEDTGAGVPAGNHDALFEPFHSTKPDGVGMGLAISKSIVESQGGAIFADTPKSGIGLQVTFTVPAGQ